MKKSQKWNIGVFTITLLLILLTGIFGYWLVIQQTEALDRLYYGIVIVLLFIPIALFSAAVFLANPWMNE